jgi:hypothetical protein
MLVHANKGGGRGGRGLSPKEFSNSITPFFYFPEFLRFGDGFGLKSRRVLWIEYHICLTLTSNDNQNITHVGWFYYVDLIGGTK